MKYRVLIILLIVFCWGCQKDTPPPPAIPPEKVSLAFPGQNEVCTEGSIISALQSSINFRWDSSANADSYELNVKDLVSGLSAVYHTTQTQLDVALSRNTPYSWFVVSRSQRTGVTAKSDVWKFYNAGPAVVSYAPFPAEIVAPAMGQILANGTVTLDWNGTDVDEDIIGYDIYFGTTASPALLMADQTESILTGVVVAENTTYYWKVITKDAKGNRSDSGLYQFRVN